MLDALNITKQSINLPVETKFHATSTDGTTVEAGKPYALSKRVLEKEIGNGHKRTLDVLGFQVGTAMHYNTVPVKHADGSSFTNAVEAPYPRCSYNTGSGTSSDPTVHHDTGFHALKGMYESDNVKLKSMRKSAIPPSDLSGTHEAVVDTVDDHVHSQWPVVLSEQLKLLNESPYADSLYYHDMNLRFMITGVDNPDNNSSLAKASNHRGLCRMVILRPLSRRARLRHEGATNTPVVNYGYMANWETDLFFSKKRMLGGPIDADINEDHEFGDVVTTYGLPTAVGTAGYRRARDEVICQDSSDVHYGHVVPYQFMGREHDLSPFQVMTSPINRKDYMVISDKSFHLDCQHHGVGSQRVENVTIPFRMKARFAGRKAGDQVLAADAVVGTGTVADPETPAVPFGDALLSSVTEDDPLNLVSKPVILFLSMDQKLSIEVEGYTSISEC